MTETQELVRFPSSVSPLVIIDGEPTVDPEVLVAQSEADAAGLTVLKQDFNPAIIRIEPRQVLDFNRIYRVRLKSSILSEDGMSLGSDPALIRDRNLADELVEFVEDLAIWLLTRTG